MNHTPVFTVKDLLRSIVLGILIGWLLISIHNPEHQRFDFKVAIAVPIGQSQLDNVKSGRAAAFLYE